jgi:D-alanyl-D-alanine carboxypeptidase
VEIAKLESPPLSIIAAKTMKPSQNTYTETILRALGEQAGDKPMRKNPARNWIGSCEEFYAASGNSAGQRDSI